MKNILLFFLFTLSLWACETNSFHNMEEYRNWVYSDASGYFQESESEKIRFELVHLPQNLMNANIHESQLEQEQVNSNETIRVFRLRILPKNDRDNILKIGMTDEASMKNRINQMEFKIDHMVSAMAEDSIPLVFSHYENFRGLKNEVLFHLHFSSKDAIKEDLHVFFKDEIFNTGMHEFVFEQDKINHTPILKQNAS